MELSIKDLASPTPLSLVRDAPSAEDEERMALVKVDPAGFWIRHPPKPHELDSFYTPDEKLFQDNTHGSRRC